ncbi:Pre-C2HC domain [Cinara cedri]|uniref:Pre-C2HC domain n=1 Tax=Cinara cedri TaxID=506608 RepID=A0A5E4NGU0_9HEMI|nr:Pre-C2HC domain [Cinara cedri]
MASLNAASSRKQSKSKDKLSSNIEKKNLPRNLNIQSVPSDVFNDSPENECDVFETPKKTAKRHLSSTKSNGQETDNKKPMFATTNRFTPLATNDQIDPFTSPPQAPSNTDNCEAPTRANLPPPIIVRGVLDFISFRDELVRLVGSDNFFFKSSTNDLKIQSTKPEFYRAIIHFLKERKAQYHTYQPREEKSFRVVIRNLHPSTPTAEIGFAIEELGYTVRQVANVIHKITKNKLPIFFIDLEPAAINKEIFNLTVVLHTKL